MYVWYSTSKDVKVFYFFGYFLVSNYFSVKTLTSFKCRGFCFNDVTFRFVFLKYCIYTGYIYIYIYIYIYMYIYIPTYIHLIWTCVQRIVATMDSVIQHHLSEIIYAVMYSCRRVIDSDENYFSEITEQ